MIVSILELYDGDIHTTGLNPKYCFLSGPTLTYGDTLP